MDSLGRLNRASLLRRLERTSWAVAVMLALSPMTPHSVLASLPPQTEQVITRYLTELKRVETARERTSMEYLFALADTLENYLFYGELLENRNWYARTRPLTIEDLPDSEYEGLCQRLPSMILNRDEVLIAEPDSSSFLPLARAKGLEPDREFMEIYFKTRPSTLPAYVELTTDYSGCDQYGTGILVALYGGWNRYRSTYPQHYVHAVAEQLDPIRDLLAKANCACGGPDTVIRELELFLRQYPNDEIAGQVREELKAVREGRTDIRFNCATG